MLGFEKLKSSWGWYACGKHPVAKDYFNAGDEKAILTAFANWMDNGFRLADPPRVRVQRSWRFWAKGYEKDAVVCGILKDSSDRVGRPYPLLVLGTGILKGSSGNWWHLLRACDQTWRKIEFACAQQYDDVQVFVDQIHAIGPPEAKWKAYSDAARPADDGCRLPDAVTDEMDRLSMDKAGIIPIDTPANRMPDLDPAAVHVWLKSYLNVSPNAVFAGGTPDATGLAVYARPLATQDFVDLWTFNATDGIE